jgi:multidrug efflux pump subunit AcrA (membrane-fusion protein)
LDQANKEPVDSSKELGENVDHALGVGAMGHIAACSGVVHVHPFSSGPFVIKEIYVNIGDRVKKNQILATSQDVPMRQVQLLEGALKVKSAGLDVTQAKTNLEHCGNMKDRRQKIAKYKGAISTEAVEMVQNNYNEADIAVQKSELALEMAKAQLNLCQEALRQEYIRAPMDGVVLGVNFSAGEKVTESGLLIMADFSELEVIAEVHEHDIFKIFKNQKAHIFLPHCPTPLMAHVTYVGNIVSANSLQDSDPKGSQDLRVVEVRLKLVADSKGILDLLKINMRVDVRFIPQQAGNVAPQLQSGVVGPQSQSQSHAHSQAGRPETISKAEGLEV